MAALRRPTETCTRWWSLNEEHWFKIYDPTHEPHKVRVHRSGLLFPDHQATVAEMIVLARMRGKNVGHCCELLSLLFAGYFPANALSMSAPEAASSLRLQVRTEGGKRAFFMDGPPLGMFFLQRHLQGLLI